MMCFGSYVVGCFGIGKGTLYIFAHMQVIIVNPLGLLVVPPLYCLEEVLLLHKSDIVFGPYYL